jgi:hypothetical protein
MRRRFNSGFGHRREFPANPPRAAGEIKLPETARIAPLTLTKRRFFYNVVKTF